MRLSTQSLPLKRKPRAVSTFLKKTFQLLNDLQNQDIVRWAQNGIGFIVLNQDAFSKQILPKYFKHSNYSSFVRQVTHYVMQLNMYNFHKIRQNNTQSYFHHENFDRSNQNKLSEIKRKPQKKKRKNDQSDSQVASDNEEKQAIKLIQIKRNNEEMKFSTKVDKNQSQKKIYDQKNTRHFFSEQCHGEKNDENNNGNWKDLEIDDMEDDKISINNEISERILPRLTTRELIYPSNNNLFPFGAGNGQTSTFCFFY